MPNKSKPRTFSVEQASGYRCTTSVKNKNSSKANWPCLIQIEIRFCSDVVSRLQMTYDANTMT